MASMDKGTSHSWGPEKPLLKPSRIVCSYPKGPWPRKTSTTWLRDTECTWPLSSIFQVAFFPHHTKSGQQSAFPYFHGLLNLQAPQCLGTADTHTMPVPHLSHTGSFCALPIDGVTLGTGALALLNPEGLLGFPTVRQTPGLVRKSGTAGLRKYH